MWFAIGFATRACVLMPGLACVCVCQCITCDRHVYWCGKTATCVRLIPFYFRIRFYIAHLSQCVCIINITCAYFISLSFPPIDRFMPKITQLTLLFAALFALLFFTRFHTNPHRLLSGERMCMHCSICRLQMKTAIERLLCSHISLFVFLLWAQWTLNVVEIVTASFWLFGKINFNRYRRIDEAKIECYAHIVKGGTKNFNNVNWTTQEKSCSITHSHSIKCFVRICRAQLWIQNSFLTSDLFVLCVCVFLLPFPHNTQKKNGYAQIRDMMEHGANQWIKDFQRKNIFHPLLRTQQKKTCESLPASSLSQYAGKSYSSAIDLIARVLFFLGVHTNLNFLEFFL